MDFKAMLSQLSQLSEATKEVPGGRVHKAEPGGYGRKFDTDEEGDEKKDDKKPKADAPKRGRGRPKKGADSDTGQVAKYDNAKNLQGWIVGNAPKKGGALDKLPKKKHTLKDWVEQVEAKYVAEGSKHASRPGTQQRPGSHEQAQKAIERKREHKADLDRRRKEHAQKDSPVDADTRQSLARYGIDIDEDKYKGRKQGVAEGSTKQPRWGYHIVDQKTGNAVPNTPKFKTRQEAQQYLRTQLASRRSELEVDEFQMREGVAEGLEEKDPVWNKGTPMPKDYTCHCGLYVHPSLRNPKAIHMSGCPYAKKQDKEQGVAEAEQIQIKPASQIPRQPGTSSISAPTQKQTVAGQPQKNTQVIQQGNRTLGTVDNPQLAQQIKQSIGKGEMTLMPGEEEMSETSYSAKAARAGKDIGKPGKNFDKIAASAGEKYGSKAAGERVAGAVLAKLRGKTNESGEGAEDAFAKARAAKRNAQDDMWAAGKGSGKGAEDAFAKARAAKRNAQDDMWAAGKGKTNEGDIPSDQMDMGAGLGAGRSQTTLEAKAKPDFIDLDKDGNKKETMKKAAKDKKKTVKEGVSERMSAARLEGKAHGLRGHKHCGSMYDDMEEARMYHEGYKEGLDECYGQLSGPNVMDEMDVMSSVPATVPGMADSSMDEGNAFTAALARTPKGGRFTVGDRAFTDRSGYDAAFESLDKQLNALLESEKVEEGMTVSISKGQQGAPDSVTVSAQDSEADQLLSLIKQAGLGLFGDEASNGYGAPHGSELTNQHDGIDVVGDQDGMMALIKKVTGGASPDHEGHDHDFADEEGAEEEVCDQCGSSDCQCDHGEEHGEQPVDEVESYDQEIEVAAENAPDSGAAETSADEKAEDGEDEALSKADAGQDEEEGEEDSAEDEEQVTEWANDAGKAAKDHDEESYQTDMDFITKVISGGLNKPKSTGQTTIPVVASQLNRQVTHESINDWKKLAGLK